MAKVILKGLGSVGLVICAGSIIYSLVEGETLGRALYWGCVTVTTIGYGDVTPKSPLGKVFTIVFAVVGTLFVGKMLSAVVQIPLDLRRLRMEERVRHQLGETLEVHELRALVEEVRRLGLSVDQLDHCGRAEFALAMLVSVGKVNERDLDQALKQFDRFDVTADHRLDLEDIIQDI